jgi:hypothetical protein
MLFFSADTAEMKRDEFVCFVLVDLIKDNSMSYRHKFTKYTIFMRPTRFNIQHKLENNMRFQKPTKT